jgi:hypothetical protein
MVITNMRETNIKVLLKVPTASEIQKLEKKSLVATIYIGAPISNKENTLPPGKISVQLDDQTIKPEDLKNSVKEFIIARKAPLDESDKNKLTFSLKVDKDVQMRYVNIIKQELRDNSALKINYATGKKATQENQ